MISNSLKFVVLVLVLVDMWLMFNIWDLLGGDFWGVVFLAFGFFNLTLGMAIVQMAYFYSLRNQMEEEEDEIEVHTFRYQVEKEPDSKVIQLVDSREDQLPPVS